MQIYFDDNNQKITTNVFGVTLMKKKEAKSDGVLLENRFCKNMIKNHVAESLEKTSQNARGVLLAKFNRQKTMECCSKVALGKFS